MSDKLVAAGGFCAPALGYLESMRSDVTVTYRVRWPWRRWLLRRQGWSTEWTVLYEWRPFHEALPAFTAERGGIGFK